VLVERADGRMFMEFQKGSLQAYALQTRDRRH
jgi:hypothetical protein